MSETIGVAELRQNLSSYLRRIADGERFTVTDRNRPVAELGPVPSSVRERLIAEGRLMPRRSGWPGDLEPVAGAGLSAALEHVRGER